MLHGAAVEVSQLWGEDQGGVLAEAAVGVGVGNVVVDSVGHDLSVHRPGDAHRRRIEPGHKTDEGVLGSEHHLVSVVDDGTGGGIWGEAGQSRTESTSRRPAGLLCAALLPAGGATLRLIPTTFS